MQFVPMLWSTTQGHDGNQFLSQARGAKVVLGFNEPERVDQANMSPADAARAWKQYIEPLRAQGARLGSPAIASTDQGLNWLRSFVTELNKVGGRIDFIALHWYGRGVDNFIGWITNVRQQLGNKYPVWVTEFACTSWNANQPVSQQEVTDFMQQSVAKLDSLSWVERYAWFGAQRQLDAALGSANCLVAPNGQLSDLGKKYVHG
jgi:O-glycosyl hydrolase